MSQWISIKDRLPALYVVVLGAFPDGIRFTCYLTEAGGWKLTGHGDAGDITHWQTLPEAPPRRSSFDQWWSGLGKAGGNSGQRFIGWAEKAPIVFPVFEDMARIIWEAAVAAAKSPHFVE